MPQIRPFSVALAGMAAALAVLLTTAPARAEAVGSLSLGAQGVPDGTYKSLHLALGGRLPLARHFHAVGWTGFGAGEVDPDESVGGNSPNGWDVDLGAGVEAELCSHGATPMCLGLRLGLGVQRLAFEDNRLWTYAASLAPHVSIGRFALGMEYRPSWVLSYENVDYGSLDWESRTLHGLNVFVAVSF